MAKKREPIIVKAYVKSWGYNVYDCRYCLYRKGKLKGCVYPDGCCCPVPQKSARRSGIEQVFEADADNAAPVSECEGCPYACAGASYFAACVPSVPCRTIGRR